LYCDYLLNELPEHSGYKVAVKQFKYDDVGNPTQMATAHIPPLADRPGVIVRFGQQVSQMESQGEMLS
jgi:hypothetical protein